MPINFSEMNGALMSEQSSGCLVAECGRLTYARGMCRSCYESARRQVCLGNRTWDELVGMGLALAARRLVRNPLTIALQQLEESNG